MTRPHRVKSLGSTYMIGPGPGERGYTHPLQSSTSKVPLNSDTTGLRLTGDSQRQDLPVSFHSRHKERKSPAALTRTSIEHGWYPTCPQHPQKHTNSLYTIPSVPSFGTVSSWKETEPVEKAEVRMARMKLWLHLHFP